MNDSNNYPYEFSVVMAVYNVEKYLREAVDSLISQSFGFQKIQLILVDDGSTDSSGKICDEYQRNHPHNIMVIHKDNGGVACARNDGLKYATGRFLNFMDSDDKMSRETFREVYNMLRTRIGSTVGGTYFEEGMRAYQNEQYDEAIENLSKAYAYDSSNVDALYNLANAYRRHAFRRSPVCRCLTLFLFLLYS